MLSIKALAIKFHAQTFKYVSSVVIRNKSTTSKEVPNFDETYTEVVDRLIKQSKARRERARKSTGQPKQPKEESTKPPPKPKTVRKSNEIKMTISKSGEEIVGRFTK